MPLWKQRLLARIYRRPAGDDGDDDGSGNHQNTGDDGNKGGENNDDGNKGGDDGDKGDKGGENNDDGNKNKGKNKPTDAEAKLLKENMQKKADLRKAQDDLAAANARLAEFDGLDASELKQLVADKKAAEEKALAAKGDFDTLKKRMAEDHSKAMQAKDTENAALKESQSKLVKQIEELTVGQAFSNSSYITEETVYTPAKARKVYGDHFDVVEGEVVAFDKPRGAAGRTALVDQYANNLPFEAAMAKLVEADPEKDHILKAKGKSGAGSDSRPNPAKKSTDTPTSGMEKIQAGLGSLFKTA